MTASEKTAADSPPAPKATVGRMPGLDGLRALAVAAVVVYHFDPSWLPGGFFGVDVFFVISGFLITGIVVREWQRTGRIGLQAFWGRRARRLLPAVVTVLGVVVLVSAVFAPDALVQLRTDVPAALFYVTNWWFIFHRVSYFEASGRPPLLLHLWSLAIEEQFYVVWPLILALVLPRVRHLRRIAMGTAAAALASTALMAALYQPNGTDPSRVYFGTDTHAQGLLIGCTLALVLPRRGPAGLRSLSWPRRLDGLGVAGLAALGWLVLHLDDHQSATYRGGFLVVDLAAAAVVVAASSGTLTGRGLACRPLRWVGTRSYAIYLWHWPVQQLMRARTDVALSGIGLFALQTALILLAAEASYRCVEEPFRSGRAQVWLRARFERARWPATWVLGPGVFVIVLTMITLDARPPRVTGLLAQGSTRASRVRLGRTVAHPVPTATPTTAQTTAPATVVPAAPTTVVPAAPRQPVLAIGDSVMLGCSGALQGRLGSQITVDAAVDRHVLQGVLRLEAYQQSGRLASYRTLVIGLGTNGPLTAPGFDQLVGLAGGIPNIVFVNTYDDRSWESSTNAVIAQGAATHPGIRVVDWHAAVAANPSLLGADGIHPDPAGITAYAGLFVSALDTPARG